MKPGGVEQSRDCQPCDQRGVSRSRKPQPRTHTRGTGGRSCISNAGSSFGGACAVIVVKESNARMHAHMHTGREAGSVDGVRRRFTF